MRELLFTSEDPQVGDVLEVTAPDRSFFCQAEVEAITADKSVLWTEQSAALPRKAFLKQPDGKTWASG